jgi:hypothetical protein
LGSHLVTPRRGYLHHGIYVGVRKVVSYPGRMHGLRGGAVEEVPFAHFAPGLRLWVRSAAPVLELPPSRTPLREAICGGSVPPRSFFISGGVMRGSFWW